jgi:vacuolar-type H+-ATPase subunit I/STV1
MTEKEIKKLKQLFDELNEAIENPYSCETGFQGLLADLKEKIADEKLLYYKEFLVKKALDELRMEVEVGELSGS